MLKAVLFNLLFLVIFLFSIETFFTINQSQNWISNNFLSSSPVELNNDIDIIERYKINENLLKNIPWPYPDPNDPEVKKSLISDLDYSRKFGEKNFDTFHLIFSDGTGIVKSKLNTKFILYSTKYSHVSDENNRSSYRISSFIPKVKKFAIHIGDSFLYGEGNPQDSTLTSQLNLSRPQINHYNFGVPGSGPNDHYYLIEQGIDKRFDLVKEDEGLLIYHYIDFHIQRAICTIRCFEQSQLYRLEKPEYKLQDNKPILNYKKFIDDPKYFLLFSFLSKLKTLSFFKFDVPREFDESDYYLTISLINSIFLKYQDSLNIKQKIIVIHPRATNQPNSELIQQAASRFGIRIIDYSKVNMKSILQGYESIPIDGHPSPAYNFIMSQMLKEDL